MIVTPAHDLLVNCCCGQRVLDEVSVVW